MFKLLTLILMTFTFNCQSQSKKVTKKNRPNILFIMGDDHTSQAWGVYKSILNDYVKTPNIKRLADEGVVLDNSFCSNSICTPSRATILTGEYSNKNGVYTLGQPLEPDHPNVAKVLQKNGYQTAIIGKWHLLKEPSGFDYFNVLGGQGRYHDPLLKSADNWEDGHDGGKEYKGFSTDVITDLSVDWMKNRNKNEPFFLMCHFKAPHEPYDYPERYANLYKDVDIPEPESLLEFGPEASGRTFDGQPLEELIRRYKKNKGNHYPGMPFSVDGLDSIQARKKVYQKFIKDFMRSVAAVDENIGKLLDYLDKEGLAENTVVVYTADQGYFLGEHGFFDKRLIYEESLRMPFVIRYPKELPANKRVDDIILNSDFAPLFLDLAGIVKPDFMQGRSFLNNLKGETPSNWRTSMYYRYWMHQRNRPGHFGIRNKQYKLIFFYGRPLNLKKADKKATKPSWEFYDLKEDPKEMHNAYNDPEYNSIIEEMKVELLKKRKELGDTDENYPQMQKILEEYWYSK